jgi:uncharacterized membrane protein YgcG
MKKFIFILVSLFLAVGGFSNFAYADANDFTVESFDAHYYLSKDSEGRAVLKVVEEITAIFPNFDQNHGIERAIPKKYQGHVSYQNDLTVYRNDELEGIADTKDVDGNKVYRIGNSREYVHGKQVYRLEYSFRDVMRSDLVENSQTLIWNVNGTQWKQNFGRVSATIFIDEAIAENYKNYDCYFGEYGAKNTCQPFSENYYRGQKVLIFSQNNLSAGENLTFVANFKPETFKDYVEPNEHKIIKNALVFALIIPVAGLMILIFIGIKNYRSEKTHRSIVPQYLPPKEISLFESSVLLGVQQKSIPAMIVKMAVSGNLKIVEIEKKGVLGKKEFRLERLSDQGLDNREKTIFNKIFSRGESVKLKDISQRLGMDFGQKMLGWAEIFRNKDFYKKPKDSILVKILFGLSFVAIFGPLLFDDVFEAVNFSGYELIITLWFVLFTVIFVLSIVLLTVEPKSLRGAEMLDHLNGLKMYIKMAEEDRMRVLQSVDGADRIVDGENSKVKLYEKLLPYAMIFGLEKTWLKELAAQYPEGVSPDWYHGSGVFNGILFANSMSSMSRSLNSYTLSASSVSGGGGGFSGGGGGGGGGGGW